MNIILSQTKESISQYKEHGYCDFARVLAINENGKKIKAAGGIASIEDAEEFINLGASRLGTSRIVKIVKNEQGSGY